MIDRQIQTAELLKLLGDDTAEAVLAHLPDELARTLRRGMQDADPERLRLQEKRELVRNFESFFDFAMQAAPAAVRILPDSEEQSSGQQESPDPEPPPEKVTLTGDAMTDLTLLSIHQLSGALETEQPRTVAILLNSIPPQLAANVLSFFPDDHREHVVRQLSKEQNAPPLLIERIARATVQRGITLPADAPDRRDHADKLGEVMREVPKSYRKDMLAAIEEEDAELAAVLLKKLYRFEDLANLDSQIIQQILGEIDATTLTTAMFQADEGIINAILSNLSRRARQTIEEELQFQTRVPESKVREARESVAELVAKADQEGE